MNIEFRVSCQFCVGTLKESYGYLTLNLVFWCFNIFVVFNFTSACVMLVSAYMVRFFIVIFLPSVKLEIIVSASCIVILFL